jgi:hypothetical protein
VPIIGAENRSRWLRPEKASLSALVVSWVGSGVSAVAPFSAPGLFYLVSFVPQKPSLLACIASGLSTAEAIRRSGIPKRTAYRRIAEPAFQEKLNRIRCRMINQCVAIVARSSSTAARTLRSLLSPNVPNNIRLAASRILVEQTIGLKSFVELEQRICEIERKLGGARGKEMDYGREIDR